MVLKPLKDTKLIGRLLNAQLLIFYIAQNQF